MKKAYAISQTITYQIEIDAVSEEDALDAASGIDVDRWEVVQVSDRIAVEL